MNEIKINKQEKSITIINNGIAFSQFGIAKEILDLVDNQQQEIERLNNIINELEKDSIAFKKLNAWIVNRHAPDLFHKMEIIDKLKELKDSD